MRVAILGCGPAGLLSAHAAHLKGSRVTIFSKPEKSFIYGAQYLHRPIPLLTKVRPDGRLTLAKWGDEAGYARKVYGNPSAPTSWRTMAEGTHEIWSMQDNYEKLYDWWGSRVQEVDLSDGENLRSILWDCKFDLVVSTVPARAICQNVAHKFESQPVWVVQTGGGGYDPHANKIIYDGSDGSRWYRMSEIFGHGSFEYAEPPGIANAVKINKPLWTNCNCWPNMMRVGRYGAWEKQWLAHHAFEKVLAAVTDAS